MRLQAPPALSRALATVRARAGRLRAHRFWLECAAVAGFSLLAAAMVGRSSLAHAARLESETARLERVREEMDLWLRELQPPSPAESAAWRESDAQFASLGGDAVGPLGVAGRLTRRAEEVGVYDLGVRLARSDSMPAPPPVEAGGWMVETGSTALEVDFVGEWPAILGFLGALPPEVRIGSVEVDPAEGGLRARAVLFTRQAAPLR